MKWLTNIFKSNNQSENSKSENKIDYFKITSDWNADPVSPGMDLEIIGNDLVMEIFVNYLVYDNYKEGDKAKITFENCSEYSLNTCNDEGYYYGQYRTNPNELPWGEFYEISNGLNRDFPEPVVRLQGGNENKKHFMFFFKDETFECLASDFSIEHITGISSELPPIKIYNIFLEGQDIGTSQLEKADAPMGVAFGLIKFNGIKSPYEFFKEYCLKKNIIINTDDPDFEFIDTQVMSELRVFRQDGLEIKGAAGNAVTGMKSEGYEISVLGIGYPFYEEEFPNHVKSYNEIFKEQETKAQKGF